jgi:tetratricopeptide (TPR) repeat protein
MNFVSPTARSGVWGINMTKLSSAGFEKVAIKTDSSGNITSIDKKGSFVVGQQATTFSYGKQVTEKLSMGLALKRVSNTVDTFAQSFSAIDASMFSRVNKNYRFALAVRNAVSQAPADSSDRLPLTIRIGNAYSLLNDRIILAADLNSSRASGFGWNVGTEYWATRKFAFRLGIENRDGEISETTGGFGFGLGKLNLDLAFGISELGMSQRFSLGYKFGKSAESNRDKEVERLIKSGNAAFAKGNYAQAVAKLEAAFSVDPSNKNLKGMIDKLNGIAGSIPAATGDGEVDRLVRQGVAAYVAGDLTTAYDSLRTAFEQNPSNQRLMNFTNRVARLAGQPIVEPPRNSVSGARWTLVDQKLHDGLQAIYEGRYDVAINKCEEVLRIDPSNVTAIGRMGAAFFLLGEKEKAIKLWKRALELEPNNETAIEYLKQLGVSQ